MIAANACKDYHKKKKEFYYAETAEIPITPMAPIDVRMDIENALDALPENIKAVAILFFFQELKQKDIAKILNIDLSLVKYRVRRAKKLLAEHLRGEST